MVWGREHAACQSKSLLSLRQTRHMLSDSLYLHKNIEGQVMFLGHV